MRFSGTVALAASLSIAQAQVKGFNYGSTASSGAPYTQGDYTNLFNTASGLVGAPGFTSARLYTMIQGATTKDITSAIPAALATKTQLLLGLWASGGDAGFQNELDALTAAIGRYPGLKSQILGISVGSEDLYRISPQAVQAGSTNPGAEPNTLVSYISRVNAAIANTAWSGVPVGHVDTWTAFANGSNDAVAAACSFIGVDAYPYFQTVDANSIDNGLPLFQTALNSLTATAKSKNIWITETGWPVSGPNSNQAVTGTSEAKQYWDAVGCGFLFGKYNTFWYTLQDAGSSPSFGVVGSTLSTTPLFDLSCSASSSSSSSASGSSSTTSAQASATSSATSPGTSTASSAASSVAGGSTTTVPASNGNGSGSSATQAPSSGVAGSVSTVTGSAYPGGEVTETVFTTTLITITSCASGTTCTSAPETYDATETVYATVVVTATSCESSVCSTTPIVSSQSTSSTTVASSKPASSYTSPASSQPSSSYTSPASTKPASSTTVASTTASSASPSANACPADINGEYQYPHLIVPVSSSSPNTAYGTSYNGTIDSTTSTIFNFDIPASYAGKKCSLIFLFPKLSQLETSSYTFNGQGGLVSHVLSGNAVAGTTYANAPAAAVQNGAISSLAPGNSYAISSDACPANTRVSFELSSVGGLALEFFEDYNPSPLGLYVRAC